MTQMISTSTQRGIDDERLPARFWAKVSPEPNTGCWLWCGALDIGGYGVVGVGSAVRKTHRLAYETLVAPVQRNLVMDHLCRTRECCNPTHLEPVTDAENHRRGDGARAVRAHFASQTHCKSGHELSGANLFLYVKAGYEVRGCRACRVAATSAWRERNPK